MSVPQFPKNQQGDVIISPRQHWLAEHEDYKDFIAPKGVILCFESYIMDHFRQLKGTLHRSFWTGEMIYFSDEKQVAIVGNFGIGGPAASQMLEILIAAGVEKFVVVGHAGGLQKTNPVGTIIISDKSVRDEGVSHHYLPSEKYAYPSSALTEKIKKELDLGKHSYSIGGSWTIDSMYRETKEEIRHYAQEGIATVEMELASLFSVAVFREVDIAAMLVISDLVTADDWEEHLHATSTSRAIFDAIEIAEKAISGK